MEIIVALAAIPVPVTVWPTQSPVTLATVTVNEPGLPDVAVAVAPNENWPDPTNGELPTGIGLPTSLAISTDENPG